MGTSFADQARAGALEAGARAIYGLEWWLLRYSAVPTTPYLDPGLFGWTAILEEGWQRMRVELDEILKHRDHLPNFQDISPDVATITDDDQWKTFFFFGYGYRSEANCARCPETAALLARVPGLTTAFFSILAPHKHVDPHRGPYRGVLRYHLGLKVPQPPDGCGISVNGEVRHWEEGRSLLLDDGYEHFVWNDTDETRAILFVDVVRPLRPPAESLNRAVLWTIARSPFLRDAKRRHEDWERRFERIVG